MNSITRCFIDTGVGRFIPPWQRPSLESSENLGRCVHIAMSAAVLASLLDSIEPISSADCTSTMNCCQAAFFLLAREVTLILICMSMLRRAPKQDLVLWH